MAKWRSSRQILCFALALTVQNTTTTSVESADTVTVATMRDTDALLTPATRWMVGQGMRVQVVATQQVDWPQAYKDATEWYAGQVEIAPDGRAISNYVAGAPFPVIDLTDQLAPYKLMWNNKLPPHIIDNMGGHVTAHTINREGAVAETYELRWRLLKWAGRLYTTPKPLIPNNPAVLTSLLSGPLTLPQRLKGAFCLRLYHMAPNVADEHYVYDPYQRKVRRIDVADRGADALRTDTDSDSFLGFSGKIAHWTFKILAEKEILAVVHSGKYGDSSQWCAPRDGCHGVLAALPCVACEKRRVWVVEGTPTHYPGRYPYSKRILYIDKEFFGIGLRELYDPKGALWKASVGCVWYTRKPHPQYPANPLKGAEYSYTEEWPFLPSAVMVDMQEKTATIAESPSSTEPPSEWYNETYFNEPVSDNTPETCTLNYLIRSAR